MHIMHIVGARPNFMKVAPVMSAIEAARFAMQTLVHTGQHYDEKMSAVFFDELGIPQPDINLEVGSGTHAAQTAEIMLRFEPVALERRPDLLLVYGDVNSTIAAALVCAKLDIPVGHVEAGLRSFDRTMPEEINRVLTDQISELFFTPSSDGDQNLLREGIAPEKIFMVGNVMIDTLIRLLPKVEQRAAKLPATLGVPASALAHKSYGVVTLHRPSNVDDPERLGAVFSALRQVSQSIRLIFPIHPRTRQRLEAMEGSQKAPSLHIVDPVGYLDFLALQAGSRLVITDSGGIQEETTYLDVPCLTMRSNTERPVTVTMGTNTLIGEDIGRLAPEVDAILNGNKRPRTVPPLWDGKAGERIAHVIKSRAERGAAS